LTTVMKIKKPDNEIYVRAFIYSRERIGKPVSYRNMVLWVHPNTMRKEKCLKNGIKKMRKQNEDELNGCNRNTQIAQAHNRQV
jgi:hypothetical protein